MRCVSRKYVLWTIAETVAGGAVAHLPLFASYGWPNHPGRVFLLCLGVVTFINAWREVQCTRRWWAAVLVFGVRLWTAIVFVGMGWLRVAFPGFAAVADRVFSGPTGGVIVGSSIAFVIASLLLTSRLKT